MKWYKQNKHYLLLAPAVLFTVLFVCCGMMMAFLESIQYNQTPTFEVYVDLINERTFTDSLFYSLKIAFFSTLLSIVIGFFLVKASYPILERFFPRLVAWLPMLFPHFIWGYMLFLLFSQTGILSSISLWLGLTNQASDFPIFFKDPHGIGIILTYVAKEVPFVILMLLPVYQQLSFSQKELVYTLGGKKWAVFRYVEWPFVIPVLLETFFIIFAFVIAAYEVPALLDATYPKMLPVLSYDWFFGSDWSKQPYAFASMIVTTITILFFVFVTFFLTKKQRDYLGQSYGTVERKPVNTSLSKMTFYILAFFILCPTILLILTSFVRRWNFGELFPIEVSLRAWSVLFDNQTAIWEAVSTSVFIVLFVLLLNLIMGIPAAKAMAFYQFKGKATIAAILLAPILIPTITVAMGLHLVFIQLGLTNTIFGVVLVHLLPTLPYTIKILRAAFERIGKKQEEVAISLGANSVRVFLAVYLPQLRQSIRSVTFLVTVISLGQYLLTALIGGGSVTTMAIIFFPFFQTADDALIASFAILFVIVPIIIWLLLEGMLKVILMIKN
ncbi:ABC transporter permease subunit [Bacillus weihaiensis]|nr:ABC transporter permease subunit [Bacillus weihaiensis]